MYVSLLGISGVLYLSVFEQPASRAFSESANSREQRARSRELGAKSEE